ncbi:MAG TPA: PadR family transcriptional regulator [Stellaceae bacterium]|jgi:DNA-binding PadR family transcriptional regulator|nr:PadR family transcriptional regulator [Stellaceae bacterium]
MQKMFGHRHDDRRHARGGMFGFGGGRFGGHGHGSGRGGRLGRFFDHGDLRYVLLGLIAEHPRHGYELIKAIEERFGGLYSPSPGVVYPTLTLLEELGYIQAEAAEGSRKRFAVTPEGSEFLAANQAVVDQIFARMAEVTRTYGGGPAPEIRRAMQNLEAAVAIRLGRGPLGADEVRALTAILDQAAREIERS